MKKVKSKLLCIIFTNWVQNKTLIKYSLKLLCIILVAFPDSLFNLSCLVRLIIKHFFLYFISQSYLLFSHSIFINYPFTLYEINLGPPLFLLVPTNTSHSFFHLKNPLLCMLLGILRTIKVETFLPFLQSSRFPFLSMAFTLI